MRKKRKINRGLFNRQNVTIVAIALALTLFVAIIAYTANNKHQLEKQQPQNNEILPTYP